MSDDATTTELRFAFGDNWRRFLCVLDDERVREAETALELMLGDLRGLTFLDIGCGSGLSSLAARRLGAQVVSFDFDPQSVACTEELRRRYFPDDPDWRVLQGSALDQEMLGSLGLFDVVYSWGVLHHTGALREALTNAALPVAPGGRLFVAIYNDQGGWSRLWKRVKVLYNRLPTRARPWYTAAVRAPREFLSLAICTVRGRPGDYVKSWTRYRSSRGMDRWRDMVDWVGGLPFEVAKPEEIFDFYTAMGFTLLRLKTCGGGLGCNEFVFRRTMP